MRAVRDDRTVVFQLPDGTFLSGMLNDEWTLEEARSLCGRMADLRKAYRQSAAFPGHHFATVVAAWSEDKGEVVCFFIARALIYGETAAVYGFNRVSRFLAVVASRCADLVLSTYFDDYTQIETEKLAALAEDTH